MPTPIDSQTRLLFNADTPESEFFRALSSAIRSQFYREKYSDYGYQLSMQYECVIQALLLQTEHQYITLEDFLQALADADQQALETTSIGFCHHFKEGIYMTPATLPPLFDNAYTSPQAKISFPSLVDVYYDALPVAFSWTRDELTPDYDLALEMYAAQKHIDIDQLPSGYPQHEIFSPIERYREANAEFLIEDFTNETEPYSHDIIEFPAYHPQVRASLPQEQDGTDHYYTALVTLREHISDVQESNEQEQLQPNIAADPSPPKSIV